MHVSEWKVKIGGVMSGIRRVTVDVLPTLGVDVIDFILLPV